MNDYSGYEYSYEIFNFLEKIGFYNIENIQFNNKHNMINEYGCSFIGDISLNSTKKIINYIINESYDFSKTKFRNKKELLDSIDELFSEIKLNIINRFKDDEEYKDIPDFINKFEMFKLYDCFHIRELDYDSDNRFSIKNISVEYPYSINFINNQNNKTLLFIKDALINYVYNICQHIYNEYNKYELEEHEIKRDYRKNELENILFSKELYKQKIINDIVTDFLNKK